MRASNVILSFGTIPFTSAILTKRILDTPVESYLQAMCLPTFNYTELIQSGDWDQNYFTKFANSPFPCEKVQYLQSACGANDTTELDFLAEQQCFCKGSYFANVGGCDACFLAHGYTKETPTELAAFSKSISSAECSASPPSKSFNEMIGDALGYNQSFDAIRSSIINAPPQTLGSDSFPSKTEVSNYWKSTVAAIPGEITGSATGRLATYAVGYADSTGSLDPAKTPASGGFAQGTVTGTGGSTVITTEKTPVASANTATASSVAATTTASSARSLAVRMEIGVIGGFLGVVAGAVALL